MMVVVKPFYRIAEAGTHWWAIYNKYYKKKLLMTTPTYNPCFLLTTTNDAFGIIGIQTDDIIIYDKRFAAREKKELQQVNYIAKLKQELKIDNPLIFNNCILSLSGD
jgi:hypothetical protein